jgi:hypothetical protein
MKFRVGDVLINGHGDRYEVLKVRKDDPKYPYLVGKLVNNHLIDTFGADGEWWGTGGARDTLDVVLDLNYLINKQWEKYEDEI